MGSTAEWREQIKDSVKMNTEQCKLINMNNREDRLKNEINRASKTTTKDRIFMSSETWSREEKGSLSSQIWQKNINKPTESKR